jgi:ABC-type amino acid transport substrate-binding protein
MKVPNLMTTALLGAGLVTALYPVCAQTLKKIADSNKITVSYRESSVPFSYLISPNKHVGFAVDLTDAICRRRAKKISKSATLKLSRYR